MDRKALRILALVATAAWVLAGVAVAQPFGGIDTPTDGQTVSGVVRVSGFVLDMSAVDKIEVLVDGAAVNTAEMNLPRLDLLEIFPAYAGSPTSQPGFLTSFLASNFADGQHTVAVRVTESDSQAQTIVASVTVVVDNTINQAPFGFIDVPGAADLTGANGSFQVIGWALDDTAVNHIDFLIDGQIVAGAVGMGMPSTGFYGATRPDVQAAFPDVPNSLYSGFYANIDTTALVNGIHLLSVRAWDNLGASRDLGIRTIQVINDGQNLGPFGAIDFPLDKASLFCETIPALSGGFPSPCTPEECGINLLPNVVNGWSLDVGARLDTGGVAYVELLFDGAILANTRTDCVQLGQALVDCYGINRPDIARFYSGYVNADNSGYNFTFYLLRNAGDPTGLIAIYLPTSNPNFPILVGYTTAGAHTVAIRAGDLDETVTQFSAMSVEVLCDQIDGDQPAFGFIDSPTNYQYISGTFQVFGWAYDLQGVSSVELDVDGQVVGNPTYGLFRPDVPISDPRVPSPYVGLSFMLDTTTLSNSAHDIVVYVIDHLGNRTEIGRRKAVVNNNVSTH
ncbi:MAG TPA: Ig-like domain-containing protein [Thermoanaerobaculia bacterium]|nr:Ig-like domain-containing protein [Thermoanaerobaculia bacterium]